MLQKTVEDLFEVSFAYEIQKLMSDRKTGYSPLNVENSLSVPHGFMFAYNAHEKINNLLSVLHISFYSVL